MKDITVENNDPEFVVRLTSEEVAHLVVHLGQTSSEEDEKLGVNPTVSDLHGLLMGMVWDHKSVERAYDAVQMRREAE